MSIEHFAHKAASFEQNKNRVDNVANIAHAVLSAIALERSMHVMDFGSGTGLLLEKIAPHVGKMTAVDVSKAMNQQLQAKKHMLACELDIVEIDLTKAIAQLEFDGIVSSMTMHHIEDIRAMFQVFFGLVKDGGFIAISDLDLEDGSFHSEDTGVFHCGFDREKFASAAASAGFQSVSVSSASVVQKPHADFGVFLLTTIRPAQS